MNDATWNEHLSGDQWFNVAKFPTMTFKSTKVVKTGDKTMDVTGDFTLLGVTKPVTLKVVFNKKGKMMQFDKAGFNATAMIDRTEFGMTTYAPMIGTDVEIRINVEGELIH
jgi:polyisoprenoid-binding protein YceI